MSSRDITTRDNYIRGFFSENNSKREMKKEDLYFSSGFSDGRGEQIGESKWPFSIERWSIFGNDVDYCKGIIEPHKWRVERGIFISVIFARSVCTRLSSIQKCI